jgi:hypothetical protein
VTFGPIVAGTSLPKYEVIRPEELAKWSRSNRVHGSGFEVHQNSSRNIPPTRRLVEVNINSFKLEIRISVVGTRRINTMFIRNHLPKLSTYLIATLTALNMDNFSHRRRNEIFNELLKKNIE